MGRKDPDSKATKVDPEKDHLYVDGKVAQKVIDDLLEELNSYRSAGDKFEIDSKIATGNMGAIYRVNDMKLQRTSVLKIILPHIKQRPEQVLRFVDEARITGRLEHPNIIPINDIGVLEDDQIFIAMKYIEGQQLRDILKAVRKGNQNFEAKYSLFSLLTIFRKVCDACAFAHSKGVLHRDIKPENIMVGRYGEVLLVDWGLARKEDEPSRTNAGLDHQGISKTDSPVRSQHGAIQGTPAYMSPEQAKGLVDKLDRRTDIFLLGATLYTIATLYEPYGGQDVYEVVNNAENCNFIPPALRAPERQIPEELSNIICRAMQYHAKDRYQSVEELAEDLDALMEGRAVSMEKEFSKGEILIQEGEIGKVAYVVLSGRVEVYKTIENSKVKLVELSEGDCVGEMSMISDAPRSASVLALEDTKVVVITKELIQRGLEKLPPWMEGVVRALVDRLRAATTNIHPLMSANCNYHVMAQLRMLYPLIGEAVEDNYTKSINIALKTNDLIDEISYNLCLSTDRVTMIISKLLEIGMLRPLGNKQIMCPNFYLFCQFVDYVGKKQNFKSHISTNRMPVFFASEGQMVMSLQDPKRIEDDLDLEEILPYATEKVLGCKETDEIKAKFALLYDKVQSMPTSPPLGT